MKPLDAPDFNFRPMTIVDVPWIVELDKAKQKWNEKKISSYIGRPNRYIMVIELAHHVVAWLLVAKRTDDLFVLRLECHDACRDGNYLQSLDRWVRDQARSLSLRRVCHAVREHDLDYQMLLKSEGYLCTHTYKGFYSESPDEDCYFFEYLTLEESKE